MDAQSTNLTNGCSAASANNTGQALNGVGSSLFSAKEVKPPTEGTGSTEGCSAKPSTPYRKQNRIGEFLLPVFFAVFEQCMLFSSWGVE